jgi:hypothetical protein
MNAWVVVGGERWWFFVSNAGVGLLLLKSRGSLLECPSSLSSGVLQGEGFCLLEDKDAASSIIF